MDLFAHVYERPTTQLVEQDTQLQAELDAEAAGPEGAGR
jgi:pyruvate dehydrogenase E1 component alpha subunit